MKVREVYAIFKRFYDNFLRVYRKDIIINLICALIACFLEFLGLGLIIPILSKFAFSATKTHVYTHIGWLMLGIVILFIVKNLVLIGYMRLNTILSIRLDSDASIRLLSLIQNARYEFLLKFSSDHWLNAVSQVCECIAGCVLQLLQFIVNGLLALTLIVFLAVHMPAMMGLSLVLFGLYVMGMQWLNKYDCGRAINLGNPLCEQVLNKEQSFLFSIKELYLARTSGKFLKELGPIIIKSSHILHTLDFARYLPSYIFEIAVILFLGCSGWISIRWYGFEQTFVYLGAWSICIIRLIPFVNRLSGAWYSFYPQMGYVADFNRDYEALMAAQKPLVDTSNEVDLNAVLELDHVNFGYKADQLVLQDINLKINPGEFIGIVGKSGAGKTTLVDILLGLLPPTQGTYKVGDQLITHFTASRLGYVAQNPCIINGTVEDNILFGREKNVELLNRTVKLAQLNELTLDMCLLEMGKNISGGQKQRIAIARALYGEPKLLVLDEVTASLDVETERKISDVINGLKGKCTILAIAHRLSTLKQCDRILYVKEGRITGEGCFEDLYQTSPEFSHMVDVLNDKV
ncbi:MAG: ABC transporter ATP-binding protein/permease [Opitutales bacterium]|nr:ABC transporter ATP-binding protein/permease [Opitutales bacterium]